MTDDDAASDERILDSTDDDRASDERILNRTDDDGASDERLLDQFRTWLLETRQESRHVSPEATVANDVTPTLPGFGLESLVEEFTALRHELKLQTRSSRALEELAQSSLASLSDAAGTFQSSLTSLTEVTATFRTTSAQMLSRGTETSDKTFATTLAELDEALDRAREQWKKNSDRLIGPSTPTALARMRELYASQSWWQRRRTAAYHRRLCHAIEQTEEQSRRERQTLLTALLSGFDLIQQRVARTMVSVGVVRIPTVGRLVDPELMVVVEVIDVDGPAGQVVDELRRGYSWKSGLLRPAEVRAIRPRFDLENPG